MSLIKDRHFNVNAQNETAALEACRQQLLQQPGVYDVSLDTKSHQLNVRYDLQKINMVHIEELVRQAGISISPSFWAKLKRNWTHYTEENELENYQTPSLPCCSHPDELLAQRKKH